MTTGQDEGPGETPAPLYTVQNAIGIVKVLMTQCAELQDFLALTLSPDDDATSVMRWVAMATEDLKAALALLSLSDT